MSLTQKIDAFFESRKGSEKYLIYFSILFGVIALSYQYLFPMSEKFMKKERSKKLQIESKLQADLMYIKAMTVNGDENYYIKVFQNQIKKLKNDFQKISDKKNYLDFKIRELSYLLYNKQKWSDFLNSLTQKAEKNSVEIDYILNSFIDVTNSFGHVLEIELGCNGDYKDLIAYLNDIEQSDLVVDVYSLRMYDSSPIKLQFKVSVWGINF